MLLRLILSDRVELSNYMKIRNSNQVVEVLMKGTGATLQWLVWRVCQI